VKLAKRKKAHGCSHPKLRQPSELQIQEFNKLVTEKVHTQNFPLSQDPFAEWAHILIDAALTCFTPIPPQQRKPYIIDTAWELLCTKQRQNEQGLLQEARETESKLRKQIRKDKGSTYKHSLRKWMNTDTDGQESSV